VSKVQPGRRVSNYILLEQVGRGTFGEVWKARHHVWGDRFVAVKVPTDEQYVRNLQKEGMVVHGLLHPNIVRVIDLDPFADIPYLIMEFVDGRSLREVLNEAGKLPVETAVGYLRDVLEGLRSAHDAGVIHRDIKPANILIAKPEPQAHGGTDIPVCPDGSAKPGAAKVVDFGLGGVTAVTTQSLLISGSLQTDEGKSISGTLAYMAPEQQDPGAVVGPPADLYACGIVFFEMLTGTRPQGLDVPSDLVPGLPAWVDGIFRRAYTRLERRFKSAGEMLAALDARTDDPRAKPEPGSDPATIVIPDEPELAGEHVTRMHSREPVRREWPVPVNDPHVHDAHGAHAHGSHARSPRVDDTDGADLVILDESAPRSPRRPYEFPRYGQPEHAPPPHVPTRPTHRPLPAPPPVVFVDDDHHAPPARPAPNSGVVYIPDDRPPVRPVSLPIARHDPRFDPRHHHTAPPHHAPPRAEPPAVQWIDDRPAEPVRDPARPAPVVATPSRECPSCRHPIGEADNFCHKCGRQTVGQVRRCERCGGFPEARDEFCIFCGHTLPHNRVR